MSTYSKHVVNICQACVVLCTLQKHKNINIHFARTIEYHELKQTPFYISTVKIRVRKLKIRHRTS